MRIAFDGTTLRPERTGVGYYTEHLLEHLARRGDDDLIVVSNRPIDTTAPLPGHVRIAVPNSRLPRMAWMQMVAPRTLRELDVDVAHFTNGMLPIASSTPSVVTIHDMSLTMYPRYHPLRRVLLNRPLVDIAARRATAVITVSESAKRDIVRIYSLDPSRVHVVHEAAAPAFRPVCDLAELNRVRRRYGLADRVILYVGTIEPRKNLPRLIDAFALRRRAGDLKHQLVCVGRYGWLLARHRCPHRARPGRRCDRVHRLRAIRRPAGALQPGRDVRLPLAARRLRTAGGRSDGVRGSGHRGKDVVAAGGGRWSGRARRPDRRGRTRRGDGTARSKPGAPRPPRDAGSPAGADVLVGARRARNGRHVPAGGEATSWSCSGRGAGRLRRRGLRRTKRQRQS